MASASWGPVNRCNVRVIYRGQDCAAPGTVRPPDPSRPIGGRVFSATSRFSDVHRAVDLPHPPARSRDTIVYGPICDRPAMTTMLSYPALVLQGPPLIIRAMHPRRLRSPRATRPRGANPRLRAGLAQTPPDPPGRVPPGQGDLRDLLPAISRGGSLFDSRASQTFATFHRASQFQETPSAPQRSHQRWSPPNNRSSTTCARRGSTVANAANAPSTATRSASGS